VEHIKNGAAVIACSLQQGFTGHRGPPILQSAPLVTYIRVYTSGQGRSGLGIEAQRHSLAQFAQAEGFEVSREFIEVETGKGADALDRRPQSRLH
jgi:hypothetical protein